MEGSRWSIRHVIAPLIRIFRSLERRFLTASNTKKMIYFQYVCDEVRQLFPLIFHFECTTMLKSFGILVADTVYWKLTSFQVWLEIYNFLRLNWKTDEILCYSRYIWIPLVIISILNRSSNLYLFVSFCQASISRRLIVLTNANFLSPKLC